MFVDRILLYSPQTDIFVTKLLDRGADVKVSRRDGTTPLHLAAMKGFVTIGKKLIEHQAPVTAVTREGKTPLHLALEKTHGPFATLMVKNTDPAMYVCVCVRCVCVCVCVCVVCVCVVYVKLIFLL